MEISKQMAGFSGAEADDLRKAIGKKKRDLMATMEAEVHRRLRHLGHRRLGRARPLVDDDGGGRLLLQQVPRRLLRADRLPDRLPEGELPGRVHGGGDLLGDVDEGQGAVLRQPLRGDGDRGAAARRQLLRPRLRRLRQQHPLRPRRGQERRPLGRRGDHRGPRGAALRLALGLLRAGRLPRRQQAGDRVPDQVRRPRLDRGDAQGDARGPPAGAVGRPEVAGGRAARAGVDLRARRRRRGAGSAPSTRRSSARSSSSASC